MGLFTKNKTENQKDAIKAGDKSVVAGDKKIATNNKIKETDVKKMKNLYKDKNVVAKSKKSESGTSELSKNAYKILIKPLITEKATRLAEDNKYCFEVSVKANKIEVAKAVKDVYGISPISVNMVNVSGKKVRRGRSTGKRKDWKKAIVVLPKGKTIQIYEGI